MSASQRIGFVSSIRPARQPGKCLNCHPHRDVAVPPKLTWPGPQCVAPAVPWTPLPALPEEQNLQKTGNRSRTSMNLSNDHRQHMLSSGATPRFRPSSSRPALLEKQNPSKTPDRSRDSRRWLRFLSQPAARNQNRQETSNRSRMLHARHWVRFVNPRCRPHPPAYVILFLSMVAPRHYHHHHTLHNSAQRRALL